MLLKNICRVNIRIFYRFLLSFGCSKYVVLGIKLHDLNFVRAYNTIIITTIISFNLFCSYIFVSRPLSLRYVPYASSALGFIREYLFLFSFIRRFVFCYTFYPRFSFIAKAESFFQRITRSWNNWDVSFSFWWLLNIGKSLDLVALPMPSLAMKFLAQLHLIEVSLALTKIKCSNICALVGGSITFPVIFG